MAAGLLLFVFISVLFTRTGGYTLHIHSLQYSLPRGAECELAQAEPAREAMEPRSATGLAIINRLTTNDAADGATTSCCAVSADSDLEVQRAIRNNDVIKLEELLSAGANPNGPNEIFVCGEPYDNTLFWPHSFLELAVSFDHLRCVELLISAGVDVPNEIASLSIEVAKLLEAVRQVSIHERRSWMAVHRNIRVRPMRLIKGTISKSYRPTGSGPILYELTVCDEDGHKRTDLVRYSQLEDVHRRLDGDVFDVPFPPKTAKPRWMFGADPELQTDEKLLERQRGLDFWAQHTLGMLSTTSHCKYKYVVEAAVEQLFSSCAFHSALYT